jgi:hypothetical protein
MANYAPGDYIKVEFRNDDLHESEWMWVRVESDDPQRRIVLGTLDSDRRHDRPAARNGTGG